MVERELCRHGVDRESCSQCEFGPVNLNDVEMDYFSPVVLKPRTPMGWVPVSERTPEHGQLVAVVAYKINADGSTTPFSGVSRYNSKAQELYEWECIDTFLSTCWKGVKYWTELPEEGEIV